MCRTTVGRSWEYRALTLCVILSHPQSSNRLPTNTSQLKPNETPQAAVIREMNEELGIEVGRGVSAMGCANGGAVQLPLRKLLGAGAH